MWIIYNLIDNSVFTVLTVHIYCKNKANWMHFLKKTFLRENSNKTRRLRYNTLCNLAENQFVFSFSRWRSERPTSQFRHFRTSSIASRITWRARPSTKIICPTFHKCEYYRVSYMDWWILDSYTMAIAFIFGIRLFRH